MNVGVILGTNDQLSSNADSIIELEKQPSNEAKKELNCDLGIITEEPNEGGMLFDQNFLNQTDDRTSTTAANYQNTSEIAASTNKQDF